MSKKIFVNLPVADLQKAQSFYEAIGAVNNPQFSDNTAVCMVVSDSIT
jgi:predicted lactoylglutathione lyase